MLTRWFTAEYSTWFDINSAGITNASCSSATGRDLQSFSDLYFACSRSLDPFNVTEDCDLGLRLGRYGLKTVILDSTTLEEANSQ